MASIDKIQRTDGPRYVVRWRDDVGTPRKKTFRRKADAERFEAETEHRLHSGTYIDAAAGRQTFADYAEQWRIAQPHRANTALNTNSRLRIHVYPIMGARPLAAIRPTEVQALITTLSARMAPGSVATIAMTVRAVFRAAVHDRILAHDPSARLTLPEVPSKGIVPLTGGQILTLAAAMPPPYRALVIVGAGTGLRQGELLGLQADDVYDGAVHVARQVQPFAGGVVVCPPKNRAAVRTVPIGAVVRAALEEHLASYPARGSDHIFTRDRALISRSWFNRMIWAPSRASAGMPEVVMHDLRHFYASTLIKSGQSVKVVSDLLGHTDASMTLRVYSHLWPNDKATAMPAVDAALQTLVP